MHSTHGSPGKIIKLRWKCTWATDARTKTILAITSRDRFKVIHTSRHLASSTRNTLANLDGTDTSRRSRGLYDGKSESGHAYLWVYCNEDSFWFKHCASDPKLGVIVAYENEDLFFNNWYITMCPSFYDSRYIIPLDDLIETFKKEFIDPNVMENWDLGPGSSAALLYHETMHLSQLVTSPQAEDKAYGAKGVYELARQSNTDYAVYNADSWKMAATAIFAQQTFNLASPPHPLAYPPADATTGKVKEGNADSLRSEVFNVTDFTPEGAGVREQGQPFKVDTNLWEIYQPKSDGGKPPACKEPLPMNDCVNKNGKCFCKPKVCMVGADCYTIEAKNCDAECKGCQYPMEGSC